VKGVVLVGDESIRDEKACVVVDLVAVQPAIRQSNCDKTYKTVKLR